MKKIYLLLAVFCLLFSGCSSLAMNMVANALTGEGSSDVFTSDNDPELVGAALPFAIKLYESLLAANPNHEGLITTVGSLYVMYANAFVYGPAELKQRDDYAAFSEAKLRARNLYLRGANILYEGLNKKYPGLKEAFKKGKFPGIAAKMKKKDVPALYWCAAGFLAAYSMNPLDMELGFRVPELLAMINRAYELDPDFNKGSLDDFYILFHANVPAEMGGDKSRVEMHFQRALEKSGGRLASPYVSYADSVSRPAQNYEDFKKKLETALAIDVDADKSSRLVNIISQRKARYFLDTAHLRFLFIGNDEWDEE